MTDPRDRIARAFGFEDYAEIEETLDPDYLQACEDARLRERQFAESMRQRAEKVAADLAAAWPP